jgi:hypothetical protein
MAPYWSKKIRNENGICMIINALSVSVYELISFICFPGIKASNVEVGRFE